jgi:hypothetical protein
LNTYFLAAGIRAPASAAGPLRAALAAPAAAAAGGARWDAHAGWLYAVPAESSAPGYATTLGAQARVLAPGLAIISQPHGNNPGRFTAWSTGLLPLLTTPGAPPRPVLTPPHFNLGDVGTLAGLAWQLPPVDANHGNSAAPPQQFRLWVAADRSMTQLLRGPVGLPSEVDLPGSTRAAEVALPSHLEGSMLHVLLQACNGIACSRSCIGSFVVAE